MRFGYALALLAVAAVTACSVGQRPAAAPPAAAGAAPGAAGGCPAEPATGPLPVWARAGFEPPGQAVPHILGARGNIVAILWAPRNALHEPPLAHQANKILWVSRLAVQPGAPLRIQATLNGARRTVGRDLLNGPGPSYVDLPAAGCWTLNLSWSGHRDQVELRYVAS